MKDYFKNILFTNTEKNNELYLTIFICELMSNITQLFFEFKNYLK